MVLRTSAFNQMLKDEYSTIDVVKEWADFYDRPVRSIISTLHRQRHSDFSELAIPSHVYRIWNNISTAWADPLEAIRFRDQHYPGDGR